MLDARTFDVRALATVPTYDPNHPRPAGQARINDRSLLDTFEPGSTGQGHHPRGRAAGARRHPGEQGQRPPVLRRADVTFHDAEFHGTERLTLAGVLAQSSNIGTMLTGEKLTPSTLDRYLRLFGLGAPTGVGSRRVPRPARAVPAWSGTQRYTVMFGQGLSVTALQAADVFATLANDGVRPPAPARGRADLRGRRLPTRADAADGLRVV